MILKEVSLCNIRSYVDETITFPKGSVLLAGDIGCGKSSLLLAIEFALFGASRPELPAELLLRKGAAQGSVSLTFELPGKIITIRRNLKKDKDSIKQTAGEIITQIIITETTNSSNITHSNITTSNINTPLITAPLKKELTPVEMKAEILNLLGYPEDLLTKNKNYIYRYTVYTPQEEMKFILQDDAETRLNVLRKVFNIEKYHLIRDNTSLYLKNQRVILAGLKAKIEPLEQHQQKLAALREEEAQLHSVISGLEPQICQLRESLQKQQESVKALEQKQAQFLQRRQQMISSAALKKEHESRLLQAQEKKEKIILARSEIKLPADADKTRINPEIINQEIKDLEKLWKEHLQKKTSLTERISFLQKQIKRLQQESESFSKEAQGMKEKEHKYFQLSQEISLKGELLERKKQVEELFEKTQMLIAKNQTLLEQSRGMQERIASLNTCPMCLQQVAPEHKNKISQLELQKVRQAELILGELQRKRAVIWQQREELLRQVDELLQKENQQAKISAELQHFSEKQEFLQQKQEEMQACVQENNSLMEELRQVEKDSRTEQTSWLIAEKQQLLQQLTRREYLLKQEEEIQCQIEEGQLKIKRLQEEITQGEAALAAEENILPQLEKEKIIMVELLGKEKDLSVQAAQVRTKKEMVAQQAEETCEVVSRLTKDKEQYLRGQEIHHWLETFFINLTYTIEKHVMVCVHRLFNQFFQEWFALMIDDEEVSGRIDDTFTPVIEQNGYEISFAHLSGGERTSAALAYRLALNRVINDIVHSIKTKDILILDEPTDGFSIEQLDKMREVLERLGLEQTILVSHESKVESFVETVIRIRKEGHISKVT